MNPDNTSGWTVAGKKKKRHGTVCLALKNKPLDQITPEDIYTVNIQSGQRKSARITELLMNTVTDQTKGLSHRASIGVLSNVASFVIDTMSAIIKKAATDISDIDDDQKTVIALNSYLENANDTYPAVSASLSEYSNHIRNMTLMKKSSIENIKKFLTSCGIDEIPSRGQERKFTSDDSKDASMPVERIKRSYAAAISGTSSSDLVVEKLPVKIVNIVSQHKTLMIDTGVVDINVPVISKVQDSVGFTISYLDYCSVFVIRMGNTVFTTGPGNFVNLKNSNGKTKHAKRCLNPQPCHYRNCKYYHDPCVAYDAYNSERNFALSYVMQMLGAVKNSVDITENKMIRDPNFVRDLVQLGGTILIKAAQIKALHFAGKKI